MATEAPSIGFRENDAAVAADAVPPHAAGAIKGPALTRTAWEAFFITASSRGFLGTLILRFVRVEESR
ncbi:hypothetical protein AGRA3207_002063 [Actinomadura graeca]|uniref:DUF397 domain-containing protein n=1 Tax=Actinomadura graeca TaxID=2750812 RepID=A0ABX8QRG8_9ACTN|nr:hypothetical protein [Actinomadura graeca]QXJ21228.1 hypothetical protein AGRA3207_002063 [Actinomadura graeca]